MTNAGLAMTHQQHLPDTMQAWACTGYGGPEHLTLRTLPAPKVKKHGLLIRVAASTVDSADIRIRTQVLPKGMGLMGRLVFGLRKPRNPVLGTSAVGEVIAVGEGVTAFNVGDRIAGMTGMSGGCHAEYCCVPAKTAAQVPAGVTDSQAVAALFGGITALHFLRNAKLKAGETLLVIGASGAVGSACVQLAVHRQTTVTAMTSSKNTVWVAKLGATSVIDYTQTPFDTLDQQYDIIADTVAATAFSQAKLRLKEHGRYLAIAGGLPDLLARRAGTRRPIKGVALENAADIKHLLNLVAEGVFVPVIHDVMGWQQLPQAHALAESGHKRGSIVVLNSQ